MTRTRRIPPTEAAARLARAAQRHKLPPRPKPDTLAGRILAILEAEGAADLATRMANNRTLAGMMRYYDPGAFTAAWGVALDYRMADVESGGV